MRARTSDKLSVEALKAMETPLIVNAPAPLPPSETAVRKWALAKAAPDLTPPKAEPLVTEVPPLLKIWATCKKLLGAAPLPRIIGPAPASVILPVVAS